MIKGKSIGRKILQSVLGSIILLYLIILMVHLPDFNYVLFHNRTMTLNDHPISSLIDGMRQTNVKILSLIGIFICLPAMIILWIISSKK